MHDPGAAVGCTDGREHAKCNTRRLTPDAFPSHHSYTTLHPLPDPLVASLFDAVLAAGRLTPTSLALFLEAHCAAVDARVAALRVDLPPPIVPDSHRPWLGDAPGWFR